MSIISRMRKQQATYWPATPDMYGGVAFGSPILVECRWEDITENFIDAEGREAVSQAKVYVDQVLKVGGFLALGDYTGVTSTTTTAEEPTFMPPDAARPIRKFENLPNLRATEYLRTAWL